jgi:hypothetical protein
MKCFFTTCGGHLSEFLIAFNWLTIMIFSSLSMVGQVFCFCHQWWVASSDFLFFTPNGGGHFKWHFFLPPMGEFISIEFFFYHQWEVTSSDIFLHHKCGVNSSDFFLHPQWGSFQVFFFLSPMEGHFKWFFHLPRYLFTFLVHKIWIFSFFNC